MEKERVVDPASGIQKSLRKETLAKRDRLSETERLQYSRQILKKVTALPEYQTADWILAYASFRSEVDTKELIDRALADRKRVLLPKVEGSEMRFWEIHSREELKEGFRGIMEPEPDETQIPEKDAFRGQKVMMWMPGVAFDAKRNRIGYGGGYYDRYLAGMPECELCTAALGFSCQIIEEIPVQRHDIAPDLVITEMEIYR